METWDAVRSRRTIRQDTNQSLAREHLERVLEPGRRASSASNWQPWNLVIITDRDRPVELANAWEQRGKHIARSAATIAVVAKSRWASGSAVCCNVVLARVRDAGCGERHSWQAVVLGGAEQPQRVPLGTPAVADLGRSFQEDEVGAPAGEVVTEGESGLASADQDDIEQFAVTGMGVLDMGAPDGVGRRHRAVTGAWGPAAGSSTPEPAGRWAGGQLAGDGLYRYDTVFAAWATPPWTQSCSPSAFRWS